MNPRQKVFIAEAIGFLMCVCISAVAAFMDAKYMLELSGSEYGFIPGMIIAVFGSYWFLVDLTGKNWEKVKVVEALVITLLFLLAYSSVQLLYALQYSQNEINHLAAYSGLCMFGGILIFTISGVAMSKFLEFRKYLRSEI